MIEDIKKEIKTENSVWNPYFDMIPARINYISTDRVCEILDKYKDKEDKYKKCWEELKNYRDMITNNLMQELEQKHGIEVQ